MHTLPGLRKILWVSRTAEKTQNEWVLNKVGVKRELLDIIKARKLAYYGRIMRKQGSWLEKEIMQGTTPGARSRAYSKEFFGVHNFKRSCMMYQQVRANKLKTTLFVN